MLALYRTGRQADALRVFEDVRTLLDDELGLPPSADLLAVHGRILRHDPTLDGPAGAPAPEPVGRPRIQGNLPVTMPSLIGRTRAIDELAGRLEHDRLVTAIGPGGVGKTALTLAVASRAAADGRYPDGVWLIELAHLRAPESMPDVLNTALRISPVAGRTATERLIEYLGSQHVLLVLDNCEHLIDDVAALVQQLVIRCADLAILATSQVPLNLALEAVYPVRPLTLRDPGGSSRPAAVRLFLDRAARISPGFAPSDSDLATIAELCRRLDGMPLAIELAAGRMRFLTPRELLAQLPHWFRSVRVGNRVAADRHATLRDVVEWSYGLLEPAEQDLFLRLSVFRGGFGLADAATVAPDPETVVELLGSLVDRSMVQARVADGAESTTFSLLETLRAFGGQRLAQQHQDHDALRAHAEWAAELVRRGAAALLGQDPGPWVRLVAARFDDLRAAHSWALDNDLRLALTLVSGLAEWLELQDSGELMSWAETTARRAIADGIDDPELERLTVTALTMAAAGERFRGDLDRAHRLADEALSLISDPADPVRSRPLYVRCEVSLYQGRLADCLAFAALSEPFAVRAGDVLVGKWCEMNRILALAYGGQVARARDRAETLAGEKGLPAITRAWSRYVLGEVLMDTDPDRAGPLLEQVVQDAHRVADRFLAGVALVSAASVRARRADPSGAVPLFREVVEHWHRIGNWTQRWTTFRTVADVLARLGDPEPAAVLVGAAREPTRPAPAYGPDADRLDDLQHRLLGVLGEQRLTRLLATGAAMSDDDVFRLVRVALAKTPATKSSGAIQH